MPMNVKPIPTLDPRINEIRELTAQIVNHDILPNERKLWAGVARRRDGRRRERVARELRESIKEKVKQAGLWAPHLPPEYGGAGLGFLEHAYMNEVLAYSMGAAALFGVVAPNSGQPDDPAQVRHRGAEEEVARAAHRGQDGVGLLDDRAGPAGLGPALDQDHRAPRRRRVGDQRPQVVHLERDARRLLHRHVPHREASGGPTTAA